MNQVAIEEWILSRRSNTVAHACALIDRLAACDDPLTVSAWFDACLDCRRCQDPNRLNPALAVSQ
jgi:hypothetical protein